MNEDDLPPDPKRWPPGRGCLMAVAVSACMWAAAIWAFHRMVSR